MEVAREIFIGCHLTFDIDFSAVKSSIKSVYVSKLSMQFFNNIKKK